ncbi:hypothetical protein OAP53_00135 [Alphaproteobacteria bacterium]|nr:hypothetical protein [Alphaproteobacteria bacterium]
MEKFAKTLVCSSIYEAGRCFLAQWMQSLKLAHDEHPFDLLVVTDNLAEPIESLSPLTKFIQTQIFRVPSNSRLAVVRQRMLELAFNFSEYDYIVFIDMDDLLEKVALKKHLENLERCEISFGDLWLIDELGTKNGSLFFSNSEIPKSFSKVDPIIHRNFLGFSNTAIRREILEDIPELIPPHLLAVDWWLFTMLLRKGAVTKKIDMPVSSYRIYDRNLSRLNSVDLRKKFLHRSQIVLEHHSQFLHEQIHHKAYEKTQILIKTLRSNDGFSIKLEDYLERGVWWEDVATLASVMDRRLESHEK